MRQGCAAQSLHGHSKAVRLALDKNTNRSVRSLVVGKRWGARQVER